MYLLNVLIERNIYALNNTFLYASNDYVNKGVRVLVDFNSSKDLIGYVLEVNETTLTIEELKIEKGFNISFIKDIIDTKPLLNSELFELGKTLSKKYFYPLIGTYQTMLPKTLRPKNIKTKSHIAYDYFYKINRNKINTELTPFQKKILSKFNYFNEINKKEIGKSKGLTDLINKEIIEEIKKEKYRYKPQKLFEYENVINLTKNQESIYNEIINSNDLVYLLYGVTGSGKTEIYIKLIEYYLKKNQNALILVPEISLTPLMISRILSYFNENEIAILHSSLKESERYDEYRKISLGKVKIVIGTRSAIFAPLDNIGLIILDEEDSSSYKEEKLLPYHAKEVAFIRAHYFNGKVILGSATPSIESMAKAKNKIYHLLRLEKRYNELSLPLISLVDRKDITNFSSKSYIFSLPLIKEIQNALKRNEQIILLVNNRGYGRTFYCRECGHVFKCPNCGNNLVYHKNTDSLLCHHCDYKMAKPNKCPNCGSHFLSFYDFGIEKVEEEFKKIFNVKYEVLDSDRTPKSLQISNILNKFNKKEVNVLIGTQIVSKGHDFSDVTLVGVINADSFLNYPSFRSYENTFNLITQTIGRAGRKDKPGKAIVQTSYLDNYAINYAINNDYDSFFNKEIEQRKLLNNPPFYWVLKIEIESINENDLYDFGNDIYDLFALIEKDVIVYRVTNISFFKERYIGQIFVKYKRLSDIDLTVNNLINIFKNKSGFKIKIDPNSYDY